MTLYSDHIARAKYHACYYHPSCFYCRLKYALLLVRLRFRRRSR